MTSSLSGLDRPQSGYTQISLCNMPTGLQVLAASLSCSRGSVMLPTSVIYTNVHARTYRHTRTCSLPLE